MVSGASTWRVDEVCFGFLARKGQEMQVIRAAWQNIEQDQRVASLDEGGPERRVVFTLLFNSRGRRHRRQAQRRSTLMFLASMHISKSGKGPGASEIRLILYGWLETCLRSHQCTGHSNMWSDTASTRGRTSSSAVAHAGVKRAAWDHRTAWKEVATEAISDLTGDSRLRFRSLAVWGQDMAFGQTLPLRTTTSH